MLSVPIAGEHYFCSLGVGHSLGLRHIGVRGGVVMSKAIHRATSIHPQSEYFSVTFLVAAQIAPTGALDVAKGEVTSIVLVRQEPAALAVRQFVCPYSPLIAKLKLNVHHGPIRTSS